MNDTSLKQNRGTGEIITIWGIASFAGLCLWGSLVMDNRAALFPGLIALFLLVISLIIGVRSYTGKSEQTKGKKEYRKLTRSGIPYLASFLCMLFILLMQPMGFELSAPAIVLAIMLLTDSRGSLRKVYLIIILPLLLLLIFRYGLEIRIPMLFARFIQ